MKIRDIETFVVNIGGQNRVLVRVLSDDHLHGTGEAYCVGPDEATVKTIAYFKDWLVGQDPMRPDTPGLGIELDLKGIQQHPPKPWRRAPVFEADGNVGYI